jgi:hypothetical protein
MESLRRWKSLADAAVKSSAASGAVFVRDVGRGLLEVSHNTLALLGLVLVIAMAFALSHEDVLHRAEAEALSWLQTRQESRIEPYVATETDVQQPDAVTRSTAINPKDLTRQQAAVAQWLSKRYKVAMEPVGRLVHEAWQVGQKAGLDPTLILAIMAVESSFNPFAQSPVGAQGLMQVMTKVHDDKYERFGGTLAAFDPVTNLRVGVQVLKECIARAGSLEGGLRHYVGAANLADDGGYTGKVLGEQGFLRDVVRGKAVATNAVVVLAAPAAPAPSASPAAPAAVVGATPVFVPPPDSVTGAKPASTLALLN